MRNSGAENISGENSYLFVCRMGHCFSERKANLQKRLKNCPACHSAGFNNSRIWEIFAFDLNEGLTPYHLSKSSKRRVWCRCQNGHVWQPRVFQITQGRAGCPQCARTTCRAGYSNNLAEKDPDRAARWNFQANGDMLPEHVTPESNKVMGWTCTDGHTYHRRVADEGRRVGCPHCWSPISAIELRIYLELRAVFNETLKTVSEEVWWRHRIEGVEFDVYLPGYGLAVEYDGAYWHGVREAEDRAKNAFAEQLGLRLIRIRERPLHFLGDLDLSVSPQPSHPEVLQTLYRTLELEHLPRAIREKLQTLRKQDRRRFRYQAPHLFRKILGRGLGILTTRSLANLHPDLAREWDYETNTPLTPDRVSPGSHIRVGWTCKKGHRWVAAIYSRSRGTGCPVCANNSRKTKRKPDR